MLRSKASQIKVAIDVCQAYGYPDTDAKLSAFVEGMIDPYLEAIDSALSLLEEEPINVQKLELILKGQKHI